LLASQPIAYGPLTEPTQLADGLVRLGTAKVNWYLVADDDGVVVVDAGVSGYRAQLEPGLELLGKSLEDVRAVLLTHSDADHTGVAGALHSEHDVPVYIHETEAELLRKPRLKKTDGSILPHLRRPSLWSLFGHLARNGGLRPPSIEGPTTIAGGETLELPGRPRSVHTPGHTVGHLAYLFPSHRALFVGDAMCTWNPLTTRAGPQLMPAAFNVSTPEARDSLGRIEDLEAGFLLPGHGEPWRDGVAAAVANARTAGPS
jgi:glyoxylase-like metal-dependent hydrolase (beta-lactamase superfamily II)